jgi:hypothetical protein
MMELGQPENLADCTACQHAFNPVWKRMLERL